MGAKKAGRARTPSSARREPIARPASDRRIWLLLPFLLVATLAAYQPALRGDLVWDDDAHVTRPELRSADGLRRIWFDIGATQQYYPVVHSTFWLMSQLWGEQTLGYHIVNVGLHSLSAFLIALILRLLGVPGAVLAAIVFALHPVHVESVAWITELKNTMSGVLFLCAALAYLKFDDTRRPAHYALALACFAGALLSKTVTASLPAVLLVVFWWRRSRLTWRRDVRPLVPLFALGVSGGLLTAWVERTFIGAHGAEFHLSFIERCLIAGRAAWFYLGKLVWPANLAFIYPQWRVSAAAVWQYLFPLAAIAVLFVLWRLRSQSRTPLAVALLFGGMLFPALGFFNVYPFRYSFVADHFQYLASIPIIALFSAAIMKMSARWRPIVRAGEAAVILIVGTLLAVPTWHQSRQYANAETLYRATLSRNPACWMCHNNLATLELERPGHDDRKALDHVLESLRLNPDNPEGRNNLGVIYRRMGRVGEAVREHEEAIRLSPSYVEAHNNLGVDLEALGRLDEAIDRYETAARLNPDYAEARHNLGAALQQKGRIDEAVAHIEWALRIKPGYADAHDNLGTALLRLQRPDDAAAHYREAVRLEPGRAQFHNNLGQALEQLGKTDEAVAAYAESLRLNPTAKTHNNLGYVLLRLRRVDEAVSHFREALVRQPDYEPAQFNLGNALQDLGQTAKAVVHYREALKYSTGAGAAEVHNNLGVALAMLGRREEAIAHFNEALKLRPDFADARANLARARGR